MEKVLLINPAHIYYAKSYRESVQGSIGLPLGLLYIAASLEKKRIRVEILDSLVSDHTVTKSSSNLVYHGIPYKVLTEIIRESKPDIVGITSQFTAQEENVFQTAQAVKSADDSILVLVGGANASPRGSHFLTSPNIDIAVKSEGEETIGEIVDFFRGSKRLEDIGGIIYRKGESHRETKRYSFIKTLDAVGFPAYHLAEMEKYLTLYKKGIYTRDRDVERNVSMITSRGCPYNCVFCSISQSMGKIWRPHSSQCHQAYSEIVRRLRSKTLTFRG